MEGNPTRSNSFLKSKEVQSGFHKALVKVEPFPQHKYHNSLEESLLDGVANESAIVDSPPPPPPNFPRVTV